MSFLNIPVPSNVKIAVVGDIHEHPQQFFELVEKLQPSSEMWLVSVGDVCDKGFGDEARDQILLKMRSLTEAGFGFMIKGNHEVSRVRKAKKSNQMTEALEWVSHCPLALSFVFESEFRLTVVHAGIEPHMTLEDLGKNLNVCYVRELDSEGKHIPLIWIKDEKGGEKLVPKKTGGVIWHESYSGELGFVAAGHMAQPDGEAKFYSHSVNLDSCCYGTGILTAQVFSSNGPEEVVRIKGPASEWQLTGEWKKDK